MPGSPTRQPTPRGGCNRLVLHIVLAILGVAATVGFIALGNWQLERRVWKLELMQRVDERVQAEAVAAPTSRNWPSVSREQDEYRHVVVRGRFLSDNDILVVAATELGSGYWVLTPLMRDDGSLVMVNRGFVGQGVAPAPVADALIRVEGLLRMSEPDGSVLRNNVPQEGRWYSRDIAAMGEVLNLDLAPYFIDAAAGQPGSAGDAEPVGGLTVIQFHNNHLVYAVTWYGLAAMVIGAAVLVWREQRY